MAERILIASDSTCDLPKELIEERGIKILPLGVSLGDKTYQDGVDIVPQMIYEHYDKTGELPHTSAVNIGEFLNAFEEWKKEYDSIVFFTISSDMSSTCNNACLAAANFEGIHVIDSRNLSTGIGLLILKACDMVKEGKKAEEIVEEVERLRTKVDSTFVIDTLEFLKKGGRCSAMAAFSADLFHIKPCIQVREGKMSVARKYRGRMSAVLKKYAADALADREDIDPEYVFVTHSGCEEEIVSSIVEQVKEIGLFRNIYTAVAGCTISSHCGPNTLGVLFIHKKDL